MQQLLNAETPAEQRGGGEKKKSKSMMDDIDTRKNILTSRCLH